MRRFPEAFGNATGDRPSVCIVTSELIGPFNNGGIGTSMTGLAQCLASAGFPVTVLYTGGKFMSQAALHRWRSRYAGIGVTLEWIRYERATGLVGPVVECGFALPYLVYLHLRDQRFDIVHFNDCMGEGFYCFAMKRLGAAFGETAMFVGLHSPSQWIFQVNRTLPASLLFAAFNYAERLSVRAADLLWSPSRYLVEWTRSRGFVHPPVTLLQKYVLPEVPLFGSSERQERAVIGWKRVFPREIVFFGRLEERKGLRLFCRALGLIEPLFLERGIAVTFLGKPGAVGDRPALEFLEDEARGWRFSWRTLTGLGQQEAVDYIRSGGALAVMASPADNSPCTVYEALAYGVPFLAARTGGIPELIAEEDRQAVLFDYDPDALADKLRSAIWQGLAAARPAEDQAETRRRWIGGFEHWRDLRTLEEREPERRFCAVVDGGHGADLAATLASLDVPEVEKVLLIDRGWRGVYPTVPQVVAFSPDQPHRLVETLGESATEAVLFLRAGTFLLPGGARRLLEALRTAAPDGLVPAASIDEADEVRTMPPLGGSPSFCLFQGAAPAGALAVKADRLARSLAGPLAPDVEHFGLPDLAVASGLEIWPFAEPLLRHPQGAVADTRNRGAPERVAAYSAAGETERYYMAAIGYGGFAPSAGFDGWLRELREWMLMARLGWAVRAAYRLAPRPLLDRLRRIRPR